MERDYLLEIGCEEIPAGFVGPALWFGGQQFEGMLKKARLSFRKVDIYGTPRRLTYVIRDLEDRQAASKDTVMGPPKSVGLDAAGKPTKAALGFAKSQGIDVSCPRRLSDRSRRLPRFRSRGGGPPGPGDPSEDRLRLPPRDSVQEVDAVGRPRRAVRPPGPLDRLAVRGRGPAVFVRQRHVGAGDLRAPVPRPRGHRAFLDHANTPGGLRRPGCSWTSKTGRRGSARGSGRLRCGSA